MNIIYNDNFEFSGTGLFTSEKEWIHPDRVEVTYEIIYVTRGEVWMVDGELEHCVKKGQALLMYPGTRHYGSRKTIGTSFYWLHFKTKNGVLPLPAGLYEGIDNVYLFKELLHLWVLPKSPEYAVNAVLCHILATLLERSEKKNTPADRLSQEVYEWIRINACAELRASEVAKHFGFSEDHVTRILKKSFGVGTKELIGRFTVSRAKELLCNTGKYVKEIAAELKFPSDKAFVTFFKYHEGVYPQSFRERFGMIHMNSK